MTRRDFPYEVPIPGFLRWKSGYHLAGEWCNATFGSNWRYRSMSRFVDNDSPDAMITFCFATAADAVYFKMRWFSAPSRSASGL